jgi:hypothetical protein
VEHQPFHPVDDSSRHLELAVRHLLFVQAVNGTSKFLIAAGRLSSASLGQHRLMLWLLMFGVNEQRWKEQACASLSTEHVFTERHAQI